MHCKCISQNISWVKKPTLEISLRNREKLQRNFQLADFGMQKYSIEQIEKLKNYQEKALWKRRWSSVKATKGQFSNISYTSGLMLRATPFSTNTLLKYCTTCLCYSCTLGIQKKKTTKQHQVFFMLRKLYDLDFSKWSSIGKKKKKKNLIIQKCYETFM